MAQLWYRFQGRNPRHINGVAVLPKTMQLGWLQVRILFRSPPLRRSVQIRKRLKLQVEMGQGVTAYRLILQKPSCRLAIVEAHIIPSLPQNHQEVPLHTVSCGTMDLRCQQGHNSREEPIT